MLQLIGLDENVRNIVLLSQPFHDGAQSRTASYVSYLNSIQPDIALSCDPAPEFVTSAPAIQKLVDIFNVDSALNDIENTVSFSSLDHSQAAQIRNQQRNFIKELPLHGELFNLVIRTIFCARSLHAGGGTTSAAIGVLWCDPRPSWSQQDFFEFFVHELTHTLMFLDERVHQHYLSLEEIIRPENYFRSAILNRPRPLDKVLHSLIVSVEVLAFRDAHFGHHATTRCHPPTRQMILQTKACLQELRASEKFRLLCTSRAAELVDRADQALRTLEKKQRSLPEIRHA